MELKTKKKIELRRDGETSLGRDGVTDMGSNPSVGTTKLPFLVKSTLEALHASSSC